MEQLPVEPFPSWRILIVASDQAYPVLFERLWPTLVALVLMALVAAICCTHRASVTQWIQRPWGSIIFPVLIVFFNGLTAMFAWLIGGPDAFEYCIPRSIFYFGPLIIFSGTGGMICAFFTWYRDYSEANSGAELKKLQDQVAADVIRMKWIRHLLGDKTTRVHKACASSSDTDRRVSIQKVRDVLKPTEQFGTNFFSLYSCLAQHVPHASLTLALYTPNAEQMCLEFKASYNGQHWDAEAASVERNKSRFLFASSEKCLALHASKAGGLFVVEDTTKLTPESQNIFEFFDPEEYRHLRCIAAYGYNGWKNNLRPVLVVFSDLPGIFGESGYPKADLKKDFDEFSSRLFFELDMLNFLDIEGGS